jgi:hypothetical protein
MQNGPLIKKDAFYKTNLNVTLISNKRSSTHSKYRNNVTSLKSARRAMHRDTQRPTGITNVGIIQKTETKKQTHKTDNRNQ